MYKRVHFPENMEKALNGHIEWEVKEQPTGVLFNAERSLSPMRNISEVSFFDSDLGLGGIFTD